ncbi:MAG: ATP-binding cassette domain-containing protein [Pseudomonadota bacterium]
MQRLKCFSQNYSAMCDATGIDAVKTAAITLNGVTKSFKDGTKVLLDFSFHVLAGSICAIMGPSGCGKSSLLRVIAGLHKPDNVSSVSVFGESPRDMLRAGKTSLLSSDSALLPWRSAIDNVRLPLDLLGLERCSATDRSLELIRRMRLDKLKNMRPHELSDGQRQRLRLAQALVTYPSLILLDEPFSAVDEGLRSILINEIGEYLTITNPGSTAIFVTHHSVEAAMLADRVVCVDGSPVELKPIHIVNDIQIVVPKKERDDIYIYNKGSEICKILVNNSNGTESSVMV